MVVGITVYYKISSKVFRDFFPCTIGRLTNSTYIGSSPRHGELSLRRNLSIGGSYFSVVFVSRIVYLFLDS